MRLPFLDRRPEQARLRRALASREGTLCVVYGRRRLGKSRLVQEVIDARPVVYFVGDDRDAALQREALAREIERVVPGFAQVVYPDWEALLTRFWREAPTGGGLALDEFPELVRRTPELPGVLQKLVDGPPLPPRHLILTGSSQRMMHGAVLDGSAPLYGRAREILRIEPLDIAFLRPSLRARSVGDAVEQWAVWGGVPRYWELARSHRSRRAAVRTLVLDPLGVLHREPERLLEDDLADSTRAASILALVGAGAHRLSEIAGRLGMPATSLSRPVARLVGLGLVVREQPFGVAPRDTKRSLYRLSDPFLRFWYRFVEPNRSRLEAGHVKIVEAEVQRAWSGYLGEAWEQLARVTLPRLRLFGRRWDVPQRWWGRGLDGRPLELDLVSADVADGGRALVGEAKVTASAKDVQRCLADLRGKVARCPELQDREVELAVWVLRPRGPIKSRQVVRAEKVVGRAPAIRRP